MKRSGAPFPALTWTSCECGCGFEGEDDVTQFCIEEALLDRLDYEAQITAMSAPSEPTLSAEAQAAVAEQARRHGVR